MADEPPTISTPEGLALLPHLTARELRVLLAAVEAQQHQPRPGADSGVGGVLWSLHTAISEAIYAADRETERLARDA